MHYSYSAWIRFQWNSLANTSSNNEDDDDDFYCRWSFSRLDHDSYSSPDPDHHGYVIFKDTNRGPQYGWMVPCRRIKSFRMTYDPTVLDYDMTNLEPQQQPLPAFTTLPFLPFEQALQFLPFEQETRGGFRNRERKKV